MVVDELLLNIFRHSSERVVDPLMITSQVLGTETSHGITVSVRLTWRVAEARLSSSEYCCSVMLGLNGNPSTDLPHLIRVETTY